METRPYHRLLGMHGSDRLVALLKLQKSFWTIKYCYARANLLIQCYAGLRAEGLPILLAYLERASRSCGMLPASQYTKHGQLGMLGSADL